MARPKKDHTPEVIEDVDLSHVTENINTLAVIDAQMSESTKALAQQLHYDGSLNPDALETGIRDSQARVTMELFHIGARLLLLKEQCAHGDFMERTERLGFSPRVSQQIMQVTLKFSNANSNSHLQQLGKTKLLELLVLDNDEIQELSEEGSVRGIELDAIDRMSVRELRQQLRDAKAQAQGTQKLLSDKNERIDQLYTELNKDKALRPELTTPDMELQKLLSEVGSLSGSIVATLCSQFNSLFTRICDHHEQHGGNSRQIMAGHLEQIGGEIDELRNMFGLLLGGSRDEWDTDEWEVPFEFAEQPEGDAHTQTELLGEE